jgi:multidrug efflux pump
MRQALGTSVFSGMLGVTFFGLLLTPVFYVVIRKFTERKNGKPTNLDSKEGKNDKDI